MTGNFWSLDDAQVMMWQMVPAVSKTSENLKRSKRKMDTDEEVLRQ